MQDVARTLAGGHLHMFYERRRGLIVMKTVFLSRPLNVQDGFEPQVGSESSIDGFSFSRCRALFCSPFCAWSTDLWPQLKNTHHRLTFTGNKINNRLAPWDKVLLFSESSSLPPCYHITFNAFKLSWASLALVLLGGLSGGAAKAVRTGGGLIGWFYSQWLVACNEEMTNK